MEANELKEAIGNAIVLITIGRLMSFMITGVTIVARAVHRELGSA